MVTHRMMTKYSSWVQLNTFSKLEIKESILTMVDNCWRWKACVSEVCYLDSEKVNAHVGRLRPEMKNCVKVCIWHSGGSCC